MWSLWDSVSGWPQEEGSKDPRRMTDSPVGAGGKNGSPDTGDHQQSCSWVKRYPLSTPIEDALMVTQSPAPLSSFFSQEDTIPKKVVCHFSGKTYADEERWDIDSCTHCYCLQGQTLCSTVSCPPLPCAEPIKVERSCCPMCPGI